MTKDEIAQAMQDTAGNSWGNEAHFQRFAALVAENEREACAKVCDEVLSTMFPARVSDCAAIIRARGQDLMPLFSDWPGGWRK